MPTAKSILRQQKILVFMKRYGGVSISQLSRAFETSSITIRRDLKALKDQGFVRREGKSLYTIIETVDLQEKVVENQVTDVERIAQAAASLVRDGDIVFLGPDSLSLSIVSHLNPGIHTTLIVANIQQASALRTSSVHDVWMLGGKIDSKNGQIFGNFAENMLNNFRADLAFLTCRAVNLKVGMLLGSTSEVGVLTKAIERSRKAILVAGHDQFTKEVSGVIFPLHQISTIVTDAQIDSVLLNEVKDIGIEVVVSKA